APVAFSIATVFLFAGPHNWLEFRYFLTRLPARWGKMRSFFALAFAGALGLSAGLIGLVWAGETGLVSEQAWVLGYSALNTLLVLWVAGLAQLRSRQTPRRDWGWVWAAVFALMAVAWRWPYEWGIGLVYLHPLLAFWLLDRELKRSRPAWRPAWH